MNFHFGILKHKLCLNIHVNITFINMMNWSCIFWKFEKKNVNHLCILPQRWFWFEFIIPDGIRVLLFLSILEQQQQQILVPLKNKQTSKTTDKQANKQTKQIKTMKEKIPRQQQQQQKRENFGQF